MTADVTTHQLFLGAAIILLIIWVIRRRESFDEMNVDESTVPWDTSAVPPPFADNEKDLEKEEAAFLEKRKQLNASFSDGSTLLPDEASPFAPDLTQANFLSAGYFIGIDSRPATKVKNLDIRSLPPVPRSSTDNPWFNQTSFDDDLPKKRLD